MDAARLYGLPDWGKGYFAISDAGTVAVMPDKKTQHMKTRVFKFIALSLYGHQYTPGHRASSLPTRC